MIDAGAHVVPIGYYRAGQLLCRATFSDGARQAWEAQHPDYVKTANEAPTSTPASSGAPSSSGAAKAPVGASPK
jgi:hypothetical protein